MSTIIKSFWSMMHLRTMYGKKLQSLQKMKRSKVLTLQKMQVRLLR